MELISINFYIVFLLIIWFDGDITNILSSSSILRKFFKRSEYERFIQEQDMSATYPCFLYETYPMFITKLLSCSICLTFWLTLIVNLLYFCLNYEFSKLIEFILWFPICYFVNLFLHLSIKKLL